MDGIKCISEELFPPGHSLVIILPLVEEHSTREEVGYLIEELHTSSRWPIIVVNATYRMKRNMTIEIRKHGSYIILVSGTCQPFTQRIAGFWEQLLGLSSGAMWQSWNPRARFVIPVMAPCTHYENTYVSQGILRFLWLYKVTNGLVVFQESSGHVNKRLQQNISDKTPSTYFSLHTWSAYENSQSCMFDTVDVPLKTFSVRNFSDIQYSGALKRQPGKNFHGCPVKVLVRECPFFLEPPHRVWNNDAGRYDFIYQKGLDIAILTVISESLNMPLVLLPTGYSCSDSMRDDVRSRLLAEELLNKEADIVTGGLVRAEISGYPFEVTHGYYNRRIAVYTPCAIKHPRWSRIFKIFSIELWLSIISFFILVIITVNRISDYGHRLHLNEHRVYGDVTSITVNMTAIALGVSVSTQPRTTPLRLFFLSWVCYCIGISTVFQAYLTSFLIDTGYKEPFNTVDQMLNSGMKLGVPTALAENMDTDYLNFFVICPNQDTCIDWAREYQNISIYLDDSFNDFLKSRGYWTDENNRPLFCELENGIILVSDSVMATLKGHPLLEYINDVIDHILEAGLPVKWKNWGLNHVKRSSNTSFSYTLGDTYVNINVTHLQSAFYMLLLGYTLAFLSFILEIIWCNLMSKTRYLTQICASHDAI
jgi:hypothetical protein